MVFTISVPIIVFRNLLLNETSFIQWLYSNFGISYKQAQKMLASHIRKKEVQFLKLYDSPPLTHVWLTVGEQYRKVVCE